jgi:hypothetical protein
MSFARSGKRTRVCGGESPSWADDRFCRTRRLNRRAKKTHTYARVRAHILHTHTQREREREREGDLWAHLFYYILVFAYNA